MNDPTNIGCNHGGNQAVRHMVLTDRYTVRADFYDAIKRHVEEIEPALMPNVAYTLEMFCDEAFWEKMTNGERRMAGRCLAHLVVKSQLPLRFAESRHEYPKHYRLK